MSTPPKQPERSAASSRISQRRRTAQSNGRPDYAARRSEIILAAADVFREKGYHAATLNDVAERLGTDRASLYYYVADKQELFHESIKDVLDHNLRQAEKIYASDLAPTDKLFELVTLLLESYEANHPQMFVYIQEDMARIAEDESSWARDMLKKTRRINRIFFSVIEEAINSGVFRDDISPRLATYALFGMMNWTHRWFEPGKRLRAAEIASAFSSIFGDGMRRG
ncbi:MAG: transcriptional regulator, TetR family [Frankiales bacterium]|nr:transcriptional regulator, TetR family [Frankiales bacterium]